MKLKFRDRLLLALYAVIGILATLGLASAAYLALFGDLLHIKLGDVFYLSNDILSKTIIVALVLIMLAWSIWVLMLAFRHKPKLDKSSVSVQNTENGSVRISVQAMDVLVRQAIGNTEGVVDIKTRIINHEDSITVKVDMTLDSDVHIPNVTMLMQRSVKNFIEEYSGIAVREVTILVSKIIEVTPHPPLALESKGDKAPEIIDQPDAMEPDESATEAAAAHAAPDEIEDSAPVAEFEADHEEPAPEETEPQTEAKSESSEDAEQPAEDQEIDEKDLW